MNIIKLIWLKEKKKIKNILELYIIQNISDIIILYIEEHYYVKCKILSNMLLEYKIKDEFIKLWYNREKNIIHEIVIKSSKNIIAFDVLKGNIQFSVHQNNFTLNELFIFKFLEVNKQKPFDVKLNFNNRYISNYCKYDILNETKLEQFKKYYNNSGQEQYFLEKTSTNEYIIVICNPDELIMILNSMQILIKKLIRNSSGISKKRKQFIYN